MPYEPTPQMAHQNYDPHNPTVKQNFAINIQDPYSSLEVTQNMRPPSDSGRPVDNLNNPGGVFSRFENHQDRI